MSTPVQEVPNYNSTPPAYLAGGRVQAELGAAQDVGDGQLAPIAIKQHEDGRHCWRFDEVAAVARFSSRYAHQCAGHCRRHGRRHHQRAAVPGQCRVANLSDV